MSNFKIIKDSCIDQNVDAIVNAANGYMMHGGGVAYAILMKAGLELNNACREYDLPISEGSVIVTSGFNIKNTKIIIHAVGPDFGRNPEAFESLYNAYYNSLIELKKNNYHSIAFPLISSGIFGGDLKNPVAVSTKYAIEAYSNFINDYSDYDIDVLLCAYYENEYDNAMEEYNKEKNL